MYVGSSPEHSASVGQVLHLNTGHVSCQYHLVYDELFTSVKGEITDEAFDEILWSDLLTIGGHERLTELIDHHTRADLDDLAHQSDVPDPFTDAYEDFLEASVDSDELSQRSDDSEGAEDLFDDTVSLDSHESEGEGVRLTRSGRKTRSPKLFIPGLKSSTTPFPSHKRYQYLASGNLNQKIHVKSVHCG